MKKSLAALLVAALLVTGCQTPKQTPRHLSHKAQTVSIAGLPYITNTELDNQLREQIKAYVTNDKLSFTKPTLVATPYFATSNGVTVGPSFTGTSTEPVNHSAGIALSLIGSYESPSLAYAHRHLKLSGLKVGPTQLIKGSGHTRNHVTSLGYFIPPRNLREGPHEFILSNGKNQISRLFWEYAPPVLKKQISKGR
jgi:uncharacterized lipoprotein YajG